VARRLFYRFVSAAVAIVAIMALTACSDADLHTASVDVAGVGKADIFWTDPAPKFTIILLTADTPAPQKDDLTATLAWPDRLVIRVAENGPLTSEVRSQLIARVADAARTVVKTTEPAIPPLVVGVGTAGSGTALALASARPAPLSGTVAVGYCPTPNAGLPACTATGEYACRVATPVVIVPDQTRCNSADLAPVLSQFTDARSVAPENAADPDLIPSIVSQVLGRADSGETQNDLDLPLVELPASGSDQRLAIIYSGDGGWADIDRELGTRLSKQGIAVVGFDTLKYFWKRKDPEAAAQDLERIISHYTETWGRKQVILVGYSFGADILPFLWAHLSDATRKDVRMMALLGLSDSATLEITVGGWIGVEPAETLQVTPALAKVNQVPILCVYGTEDDDDACARQVLSNLEKFPMPGDHHFDGRYEKIAEAILARTGALPHPRAN